MHLPLSLSFFFPRHMFSAGVTADSRRQSGRLNAQWQVLLLLLIQLLRLLKQVQNQRLNARFWRSSTADIKSKAMSAVSVIKNKANTAKVRSEISITAITTTISSHSFIHLPILPYLLAVIADTAVATAHIIVAWLDRATLPSTLSFSLPLLVTFTALSILSLQLRQQQCRLVNTPSDQESSHITHTHTLMCRCNANNLTLASLTNYCRQRTVLSLPAQLGRESAPLTPLQNSRCWWWSIWRDYM